MKSFSIISEYIEVMSREFLHKSQQHETLGKKKEAGIEIRNAVNHYKASYISEREASLAKGRGWKI